MHSIGLVHEAAIGITQAIPTANSSCVAFPTCGEQTSKVIYIICGTRQNRASCQSSGERVK